MQSEMRQMGGDCHQTSSGFGERQTTFITNSEVTATSPDFNNPSIHLDRVEWSSSVPSSSSG